MKMMKLSLAAAVAVAGLSTSASAQALTDAIQGVEISGSVEYRMEHRSTESGGVDSASTNGENAKIVVAGKTKVNDSLSFATKAVVNGQGYSQDDSTKPTQGSANINVAKFIYTAGSTNVIAGMQELATPWTDAGDGARANGVLATMGMGSVTLAAAHFRNSQMGIDSTANLNSNNLTALAAIGSAGPVGYQVWYLGISDDGNDKLTDGTTTDLDASAANSSVNNGGDALAVLLNGKFGPVALDASYASLEEDNNNNGAAGVKKQTLTKLVAAADLGMAKLTVGAAKGGDDGNLVVFDPDAKAGFQGWNIRAGSTTQADFGAYLLQADVPVGPTSLRLQYVDAEFDDAATATTNTEVNELVAQVTYKMSKNFTTYLRYGMLDKDVKTVATGNTVNSEQDRVRLSLKYTF
jgi:predicted porin